MGLFISCEEDLIIYDEGDGFVQFSSSSGSIEEGALEPSISTVLLGAGENPDGVTVNFTVTADDPSRFTVEPADGTVTIPAGEFTADITITPVDNITVDGDMDIVIDLTTASSLPVGIGGEGINFASRTVTLVDDDCPVDINNFIGTYNVAEVFTSGVNEGLSLAAAFGEAYQIEMVAQPGDDTGTKLVITNSAGFNTYLIDGTVMTLQACPGTVTFDPLPLNVALFADLNIEEAVFNEDQSRIRVSGPLGGFGPYEFVLTRQ
jgi:hypothetical protein